MTPELSTEQTEIQAASPSGGAPSNRIQHIAAAISLYKRELESHRPDAIRRARLQGMINGNPPYDPSELEELGLGYMTNVNFQEMGSILDAKAAANYELFFEVPTLIEARMALPDDPQAVAVQNYGSIVAEEFTKMCFDWSGFLPFMDKVRREADAFGLGIGGFSDKWDWRPQAYNCGSFLTNKHAKMDLNKLPYAFLRDTIQIGELFQKTLRNPDIAEKDGWNVKEVRKLFKKIFVKESPAESGSGTDEYQTSVWEAREQQIRNGQLVEFEAKQFEFVDIVHLLVPEIDDGKVSHYIFLDQATETDAFLYASDRAYDRMEQAIWWMPFNNGDGYLHSVRGLASRLETHCDMSNRFLGQVFDAGKTSASLLVQPAGPTDMSQIQLIRMGAITVLPHNIKAVQSSFAPNVMQLVSLRDLSSSIMRNNTGVFRQHAELAAEQQKERTAYEVSQEVAREARSEKANIAFDYEQVQRLYREMFRRVTNPDYLEASVPRPGQAEARAFVQACVLRGVPYDLLTQGLEVFEVYATRAIGMGSWGVRLDVTNQILNLAGQMDEQGRRNALRERTATLVGYQNVDKYFPLRNRDQLPSNEQSIATLENNDMMEGSAVSVGSDQFHVLHVNTHAKLALSILTQYQQTQGQGMKVPDTLRFLGQIIPHIQEHVQYLSVDPSRESYVQEVFQVLQQLEAFAKILEKYMQQQAKQGQKAAEEQQALLQEAEDTINNRDQEVELAKINNDFRLQMMKQQSLNQMRAVKTSEQMDIRRQQMAQEHELKAARQEAEISLQQRQIDAEIAMKEKVAASSPQKTDKKK